MSEKKSNTNQTQKNYLRDRLNTLFGEAIRTINNRAQMRYADARRTVFAKAGLSKAEDEARKIVRELDDLNVQYSKATGRTLVSYDIRPISANDGAAGLIGQQIAEEMAKYPEGLEIKNIHAYQHDLMDRIFLSSEDLNCLQILQDAEAKIQELVTPVKALPAAPAKKK